jgi:hypothetical protein
MEAFGLPVSGQTITLYTKYFQEKNCRRRGGRDFHGKSPKSSTHEEIADDGLSDISGDILEASHRRLIVAEKVVSSGREFTIFRLVNRAKIFPQTICLPEEQ